METRVIDGLTFSLDDEFRLRNRKHTDQERSNLALIIEEEGCKLDALTVARIGDLNYLCDGYTTLGICEEKGVRLTAPRVVPFSDRKAVLEWIDRVQEGRRNLSPEEIALRAEKRRQRVAAARADGKSTRAIAEKENVSHTTVVNDLKKQRGHPSPPDASSIGKPVTGRDGKTYHFDILCPRCKRTGATAGCVRCQELREKAAKRKGAKGKTGRKSKRTKCPKCGHEW